MPFIEARDGTPLFFKDWGSGRPVVLIHGWPLNADMWEYQMLHLAAHGLRVIAYDRRGFGRSGQPWSGYDYDTFAEDVAAVIERLQLNDVVLVGFSMGGGEVARYLARHGSGRVGAAVLIGSVTPFLLQTPDNPQGAPREVFEEMVAGLQNDRPAFLAGFGRSFFGADQPASRISPEWLAWAQGLALQASPKATIDCVRAFGETDFRPDMAAFRLPTLVIHGDADAQVPLVISGRLTAQMIPNAELMVYEGAPHGLFATHKDQLNADLLRFCTESGA
jgi:non-heme chloroperoxidase